MTTLVITNRLLFGPNPEGETEAHMSYASLETPEESLEGIGGMYGHREPDEHDDHDERPPHAPDHHHHRPHAPDHHHHRPHARETDHHHRPHAREYRHETVPSHHHGHRHKPHEKETAPGASITGMTPDQAAAMGVDMSGKPLAHQHAHGHFTKENADAVRATAHRLGISPKDLSTIIGYETIGSYSPSKQGLGGHTGLIQFGRAEQAKYGVYPGQTFAEQMPAVERYLRDRGVKPGMGLRDVYSAVSAGAPGRYSARDIGGSVDEHVARMQRDRGAQAERFLASGRGEAQRRLLGGAAHLGPEAPDTEHASRKRLLGFEDIPLSGAAAEHGSAYSTGHMQPEFRHRLARLMAAAKAAGRPLSVFSGYRSQEHQNRLFGASNRSGRMVARHSHHTAGTAADLRGDLAWAHEHAAEFGLRFPMTWENWHIEPVRSQSSPAARTAAIPQSTGAPPARVAGPVTTAPVISGQTDPHKPGFDRSAVPFIARQKWISLAPRGESQKNVRAIFV
jgi:hypothetical protein